MPMPIRLLLLGTLVLPLVSSAEAIQGSREAAYLSFTARNQFDIFVRDLKLEEVEVRIDGAPVDLRFLGYRDLESAVAIVMENSPRTAQHPVSVPEWGQINIIDLFRYQLQGDFFQPLTETGQVMLAEFFQEFRIVQDFTNLEDRLVYALDRLPLNFSGIVLDNIEVGRALGRAVDLLKARPERKKAIVLFTRTVDRNSYRNLEEYQLMLRNTDIDLYVVSFAPRFTAGTGYSFEEKMNGYFFRNLADETGGKAYLTGEYTYLDELFTDLKGRLTNIYVAGFFVEPGARIAEHEVELEIDRPKCTVTHRKIMVF